MNAIVSVRSAETAEDIPLIRIVVVGHVDHGKSTLIGRLLYETGSLPDGKLENLKAVSARRGMPFEWSFVLDALQTERDQNITIDTSQIRFHTRSRDFVLIDAPGHTEFVRNMVTGAAQADAAILVVDAVEGVREQTRRHGYLLQLLGVRQLIVVVNKMDRIAYDAGRFRLIETEIADYLKALGLSPLAIIPVSARDGVGITEHTVTLEWYRPTVVEALDGLSPSRPAPERALRFPVQAIYKFDDRRILAGRIECGRVAVGDEVMLQPSGTKTRIKSIEAWHGAAPADDPHQAAAGQSIGVTLADPLFVERGDVVSQADAPAAASRNLRARVFWLGREPLQAGARIVVRIGTAAARAAVTAIREVIDPGQLLPTAGTAIPQNQVGEVELAFDKPVACDPFESCPATGRLVLEHNDRIAGGGIVLETGAAQAPAVSRSGAALSGARIAELAAELGRLSVPDRIERLRRMIDGRIAFTTSFGLEDQILLHFIAGRGLDIDIVTLDTGRLFPETYALWAQSEERYGLRIRAVYPDHRALAALVAKQGINGFYASTEARVTCCQVRKVEPLGRALSGAAGWIAGLRADQSWQRAGTPVLERDGEHGVLKLNPLFDWTRDGALAFAAENAVPLNPLHARGFASIGCAPCTRAIAEGEPERAGRWWWEQNEKKECGLHHAPQPRE